MKLLLAEDERDLSDAVKKVLEINKYDVDTAFDGKQAYELASNSKYDGIIMDVMMPKMTGIEVVKLLRQQNNNTPILVLTALAEIDDKITGLDAGADDYLTKPFAVKELLARVRAITRRSGEIVQTTGYGNLILDPNNSEMSAKSNAKLTNKEYKLMELFVRNKDVLLSTEQIMERLWEQDSDVEINVVWVFISTLRKKLDAIGADCTIKAVRGVGYKLEKIE